MKSRDKKTPEAPSAGPFYSLPQFSSKPTGSPHAGELKDLAPPEGRGALPRTRGDVVGKTR